MKKLLLLLLVPCCCFAQPRPGITRTPQNITLSPIVLSSNQIYQLIISVGGGSFIQNQDGFGTNTTLRGPSILGPSILNVPALIQTTETGGYLTFLMHRDGDTNLLADLQLLYNPTNNALIAQKVFWTTNAASDVTIDYNKDYWYLTTNNNLAITGRANYDANRFNQTLITVTNSSAAAKTITMASTFINMKAEEGNTLFFTNLAQLLVFEQVGTGTNFYFKSR